VPTLTTAENAALRSNVSDPSIAGEQTVDVYRNPAAVGGTTGRPVLTYGDQPCRIRPAGDAPKQLARSGAVAGARVSHVGKMSRGADVLYGDEWRQGATKYKVVGVGVSTNAVLAALDQIKEQR
jgi:hypothetical protein